MDWVVVGWATAENRPALVIGPFDSEEVASREMEALRRVTNGQYTVLTIHKPEVPA